MAVGRITGPLLKANLLREGVNLAFETDLLYLDVVSGSGRIGINTTSPQYDLDVNGTIKSSNLEISSFANIADVSFSGNTISTSQPTLTLGTADTVVYQTRLTVDSINIENNVISTITNENLELRPNGSGTVEIFADTNVYGNIVATGSITADGNITIGDANTDNVTFNAEIASDIVPDVTNLYSLGTDPNTGGKQWANVWTENFYAGTVTTSSLVVDGVDIALRQGNIYYVAENGNDSYSGDHPNDPFGSIKHAIGVATAGDVVHIYPGTYTEIFPITVPTGVTVKGHSLRSVNIKPTVGTKSNDVFLLNEGVTIEDLTIKDFFTGYAFKFAPGFTVSTRSPYIRNVSVITSGSVTSGSDPRGYNQGDAGKGAYLDGAVATVGSNEAACLFNAVTFITPGVDALTITNGTRVEWLNCFSYFANRGLYAVDGATGLYGTGKTALRINGLTGTFNAGETVTYYSTFPTVLATGTIASKDADGKFYVSGKQTGFQTAVDRGGKTIQAFGDAKLSTAVKKFGTASLALDGTDDYAFVQASPDFAYGTGDFTIEGWFYTVSTGISQIIYDQRTTTPQITPLIFINPSNQLVYNVNGNARITGTAVSANTWNHFAVSRTGTSTRLFLNGTQVGSTYTDTNIYVQGPARIGARWDGASGFNGYIDDLRISKGVARYTTTFAVPSGELTNDSYTVLLSHFNGANASTTFVDETLLVQDIRFSGGASATELTLTDFTDFGGEIRSIGSACVYGNYGAYGDGAGVLMYLISQNFAYIGNGKETTNDSLTVIQANEVVELNNAKIRYSSVDHQGDFRVGDLFYIDQQTGTVNFTSSTFNISTALGISITTGSSTTTITGEQIDTGNLRISGNTIASTSGDIVLNSSSGTVRIDATGAFNLPTGDTASRPTPALGMVRYNTDNNLFEGYNGNWIALNGVYDLDLNTYITAELTPGANDNIIRFYADNALVADLDSTRFRADRIEVDNIAIDGNQISTLTTDTNLILAGAGTGGVQIDNFLIKGSTITNTVSNSITNFRNTGSGYFKVEGTGGFIVPVGGDGQRPIPPYREIGMTRYNTDQEYLEIFDGDTWVSVAGSTGSITFGAAENLAIEYVLALG
jgi:hypothetical protein